MAIIAAQPVHGRRRASINASCSFHIETTSTRRVMGSITARVQALESAAGACNKGLYDPDATFPGPPMCKPPPSTRFPGSPAMHTWAFAMNRRLDSLEKRLDTSAYSAASRHAAFCVTVLEHRKAGVALEAGASWLLQMPRQRQVLTTHHRLYVFRTGNRRPPRCIHCNPANRRPVTHPARVRLALLARWLPVP